MPIPIACVCGMSKKIDEDFAGKSIRCDNCGDAIAIPPLPPGLRRPSDAGDPFHLLTAEPRAAPSNPSASHPWKTGIQDKPSLPEPAPLPRPKPKRTAADYDDVDLEPPHRRRGMNSNVAGGLLSVALGAVWFFGILWLGGFHVYPLVLIVLGSIALVKGLFGSET